MRLGVLGGTFNPIHVGHLILAEYARSELFLERVVFVPAGLPWRKADRTIAAASHRVAMVRLAVAAIPEYDVSLLEVERPAPSYMAETLSALQEEYPGAELYLIIGQDALADLPNWWRPQRIVELATLAVARRPGFEEATAEALGRRLEGVVPRIAWLEMPPIGISSTDIRRRVRAGLSIRFLVPEAVEWYIREQRLYQAAESQ